VVAPLFDIRAVDWDPPNPGSFEAVIFTSANAARKGGPKLESLLHLPCYAVGEATAAAAGERGFSKVRVGPSDGAALIDLLAEGGVERALHPCGRDNRALANPQVQVTQRVVYAADEAEALPPSIAATIGAGAVALLHSPRAAALFARLMDEAGLDKARVRIAAISPAASAAAGEGWQIAASSAEPREEALLELALKLCNKRPREMGNGG
jgi:uroporphyrinogen-III synthase